MAYNKITSHFSSSQDFSEDRYFSYDNSTNKAGFASFVDFKNNSNIFITGSKNNIFVTGNLDLNNDLSASSIIVNDNEITFENKNSYFIKKRNNSISINANTDLTGTITSPEILIHNGLTGSLIYTDESNTRLLNKISGINVNVENEAVSGKDRWILTPAEQDSNFNGVTRVLGHSSNIIDNLFVTGSTTVQHYIDNESNNPVFINSTTREMFFHKFTEEHKNYISSGKFHLFVLNRTDSNTQFRRCDIHLSFSNNLFNSSQIGSRYIFLLGDFTAASDDDTIFFVLPTGNVFLHDGQETFRFKGAGTNGIGSNVMISCIDTNLWQVNDGN